TTVRTTAYGMIRKSGHRFSDKIMPKNKRKRDSSRFSQLLYSHDNCVRRARGIDHGQPRKARPRRIDQALAATVDLAGGTPIDHHSHRQSAAGDPDRHRGDIASTGPVDINAGAVERKLDMQRMLAAVPDEFPHGPEPAEGQR